MPSAVAMSATARTKYGGSSENLLWQSWTIFVNDDKSKEAHSPHERIELQSAFTRFLQETGQRTSRDTAKSFAAKVTRGNREEFRGLSEEEIYVLLTHGT